MGGVLLQTGGRWRRRSWRRFSRSTSTLSLTSWYERDLYMDNKAKQIPERSVGQKRSRTGILALCPPEGKAEKESSSLKTYWSESTLSW